MLQGARTCLSLSSFQLSFIFTWWQSNYCFIFVWAKAVWTPRMVKVWQNWRGTALQKTILDVSWGLGEKTFRLQGNKWWRGKLQYKNNLNITKWTQRGMRKKLSSTVNITQGEDVSFRIKIRKYFLWKGGQKLEQGSWRGGQCLKSVCVQEKMP